MKILGLGWNLKDFQWLERNFEGFAMAGEGFPKAGEDFGRPASPESFGIYWISLVFLIFEVARPEAWRYRSRWFSINFQEKIVVTMERCQECEQTPPKLMHSSGKHYFEAVWTHLDASGAV